MLAGDRSSLRSTSQVIHTRQRALTHCLELSLLRGAGLLNVRAAYQAAVDCIRQINLTSGARPCARDATRLLLQ